MDTNKTASQNQLSEVASSIKEMREILGMSAEETAKKTELSLEQYLDYESGAVDLPFTFIYKCAGVFGIELTDLLEGHSAKLSSYTVTRRGKGQLTAREDGIEISNLAPLFRNKIAEPYWVKYEYSEDLQSRPIHTTTHSGQEFDLVISGKHRSRRRRQYLLRLLNTARNDSRRRRRLRILRRGSPRRA